jgi:hypothetical protein
LQGELINGGFNLIITVIGGIAGLEIDEEIDELATRQTNGS